MPKMKAAIVVAALALAACDSGGSQTQAPAAPPAAPPTETASSAPATGLSGALNLLSGTAKSNGSPAGTGDWALPQGGVAQVEQIPVAEKWVQLTSGKAGTLDPVVVNGAGLTLYRFDNDTASPSKSTCNGDCAKTWPPVTIQDGGKIFIAGIGQSDVGVVTRDDGKLQVTIKGWPVYRFAKDTRKGDTNGQGVGGTWFGVQPDGGKAGTPGASEQPDTGATSPATLAVLFDEPGFADSGASQGVSGNGCQNLQRPGVTSSVAAPGRLKLWTEKDCHGRSKVIDGDVDDLGKIGLDDQISSVFLG